MINDGLITKLDSGDLLTQKEIRDLYLQARGDLDQAMAKRRVAVDILDRLRDMCKHPELTEYICPDCGYDSSSC